MIRGMPQCLAYGSSSSKLYYMTTDDAGSVRKPDSAPTISIYDTGGNSLITSQTMTAESVGKEGYLNYKSQTNEFEEGEKITGETSGAKAVVLGQRKNGASGTLYLGDIDGTFQDSESLTGSKSGSAVVDGIAYSCLYYYAVDLSETDTWKIGENYQAKISYTISSVSYERWIYFDVAFYPATTPLVSSSEVDLEQPTWAAMRPATWQDWQPAIEAAHADLYRRIKAAGELPQHYVAREQEMWRIEMALVKAHIAESCGFPIEQINWFREAADKAWQSRGVMTVNTSETSQIEEESKVIQPRFTR